MDTAIEHFKSILKTAIQTETAPLHSKISDLNDQIVGLKQELNEKNEQCQRLFNLLQSKNTEWKRIKTKLIQQRQHDKQQSPKMEQVCDNLMDITDDSTQLPDLHETQSHLDVLVSLISESESESESPNIENIPLNSNINSNFKRKGHARGCSCCEKYYTATRPSNFNSNIPSADSFFAAPKTPPGFWDTSFTPRQ